MAQGFAIPQILGRDNLLINGQGDFFQRLSTAATLTSVSDDTFGPDRWNVLTQTAAIQTAQTSGNGTINALGLKQNQASAQRFGMAQMVEGTNSVTCRGQTIRLQGQVKCSASQEIHFAILEWTSNVDAITSDIVNDWTSSTYTASNFFIANITVTAIGVLTPSAGAWTNFSITGVVGSSCNNLIAFIWTTGTAAQNVTLDMTSLDMFIGTTTRAWNPRPIGEEFALCQRYMTFYGNGSSDERLFAGWVATTAIATIVVPLPTSMRASPSMTVDAVGSWRIFYGANAVSTATVMAIVTNSNMAPGLNITVTGTPMTAGGGALLGGFNTAARMWFTAEL